MGVIGEIKVALTGTNTRPLLVAGTEALAGRVFDEDAAAGLAKLIQKQASPVRTSLTQPQYRRRAIAGLACRLVRELSSAG